MRNVASASGKIVLAGEYAMVFGSPGLALPSKQGVRVTCNEDGGRTLTIQREGAEQDTQKEQFALTIVRLCEEKRKPVCGTLTVESDLPLGKGMGSSTALVIAIARCLLGEKCLDDALAIEDHVNPGHSGMDFTVIWNAQPIRYERGKPAQPIQIPRTILDRALLIDTGAPGETTAELVKWVRSREAELKKPLTTIGSCADRILAKENPLAVFRDHHRAQIALGVVPENVQEFVAAVEAQGGAAKITGAGGRSGGGGIVIAVHDDHALLERLAEERGWPTFPL
ncbi:MAG: hypothetical protein Q7R81_05000 [Candidatus Peregrinibacteria bacterium]|nr:hypothetical protein [Candidatus Peregrinibacteria bacterium]